MSLTASMWTSVSGLINHGEKMNVVGNNIANVNTVAFKGSRMDFMDYVNQTVFAANGPSQVGRGVAIGAIYGDFSQGAFQTSTESTDLAIAGNGFFKVKPINSNEEYFTRAGNFRFDAEGYLCDPHGYVVQGWMIETPTPSFASSTPIGPSKGNAIRGVGVPTDVRLASFSCEPFHTSNITMALNLDKNAPESAKDSTHTDPFFAMFKNWNVVQNASGQIEPPLGNDGYSYPQSIVVYDEGGTAHTLTVYFDKVETDVTNPDPTKEIWEYVVTMDPAEDIRTFQVPPGSTVPSAKRGLLMTGTLTFNSAGQMTDMTAFVPTEGGANFGNLNTWVAAPISSNGYPMFTANFTGQPNASEVWDPATPPTIGAPGAENTKVIGRLTEFNMGMKCTSNWWTFSGTGNELASSMGTDPADLMGMGTAGQRTQPASTCYGSTSGGNFYERYSKQDGYTYGELSTIHVTEDGVLTGRYSNGVTLELFQITLYDFNSKTNLYREGGNLFTQTRESGDPTQGAANSGSFGSIQGNSLEQSNVDLSREFVEMITTQRGFQSNSKLITTTDTMLETVINMKR